MTTKFIYEETDNVLDRFYYKCELIFQIINSPIGFNINEKIRVENKIYIIEDIIHDPKKLNVIDYYIIDGD